MKQTQIHKLIYVKQTSSAKTAEEGVRRKQRGQFNHLANYIFKSKTVKIHMSDITISMFLIDFLLFLLNSPGIKYKVHNY